MNNVMNFSYMTRICNTMLKTCQEQNKKPNVSGFHDTLAEKSDTKNETQCVSGLQDMVMRETMSMEEYKQYIYDKIDILPVHSSNMMDSVSVLITDEGFAAMKNDPAYEQWVLHTLKTNFMNPDLWSDFCGGKFSIFRFGATKEECCIESWGMGFRDGKGQKMFDEKAEDSFWERRQKRRKEWLEMLDELEEKKALSKRMARSQYFTEMAADEAEQGASTEVKSCDALAMQIFSSFKANIILESFQGKKIR